MHWQDACNCSPVGIAVRRDGCAFYRRWLNGDAERLDWRGRCRQALREEIEGYIDWEPAGIKPQSGGR